MKALVLEKQGSLVYREVALPERPAPDAALVRVAACGVCGSDIPRAFQGEAYHYPLIMGHEFSGVIEEPPEGKSPYRRGQPVTAFPLLPCLRCPSCQTGDYAQCASYDYLGSRRDGAFAEYVWVPEANLFPVPGEVDLVHAAMTEPCAVALHGVRKLRVQAGETAVVFGAGPIGNMAAQWLGIRGCGRVILVDIDARKLELARLMGFEAVHAETEDPVDAVLRLTGRKGAEKVVEAAGLPLTYAQAVRSAARFGEVLWLGNINAPLRLETGEVSGLLRRELRIHGTWNSKVTPRGMDDWSTVLRHLDHELQVAPLISHAEPLQQAPRLFDLMRRRSEYVNKVLVLVHPPAPPG
ncbi:MAG: galactitol-1-phosphate 5-dehydrogenase [Spirochaetota bacterium]